MNLYVAQKSKLTQKLEQDILAPCVCEIYSVKKKNKKTDIWYIKCQIAIVFFKMQC